GGIERGLPVTFEGRARGLEEAVDGRGLVALAPAGGARERRGHGLGAHAATRGKNRKYIARATTADGRMESRRSSTPPCPGSQELMSLIPRSRLTMDSPRSPMVAVSSTAAPKIRPTQIGTWSMKMPSST